jgi:outer membrane protein OmpA-like peptidoglycan-associated protein
VADLVAGRSFEVSATADLFARASRRLTLEEGDQQVTLQLRALPGQIRVAVRDDQGGPVIARLSARNQSGSIVDDSTDPQGDGSLSVPAGPTTLFVESHGYGVHRVEVVVPPAGVVEVDVTLKSAKVRIQADRVEILEKVFFDFDKATLVETSKPLLTEVADTLLAHPEIRKIEIGGHTDRRGDAGYNLELSQRRVETVRDYLISRGVQANRLIAKGYGASRLLDPADNERAHALNRRVEFTILERAED